jgi:chromosome segregation ATPase
LGSVSDKRMNLYTRILETANGSEMKLFASFGYDFFIGKDNYPAEFEKLKTLMNNFLMQFLTEYYKDKIEETSKAITKNSKEKVSLLKSIEKNKGKIEDAKNEIAKLNAKKSENSEESIKILEKINKLTKEQMDLENENNQALLEIQNLDKKVEVLKLELDKLQQRQNGLIIK